MPLILIEMHCTKGSMDATGKEFLTQHGLEDHTSDKYSIYRKRRRKIKACFLKIPYMHTAVHCVPITQEDN